jgi:hypothetical protein
MRRRSLLSLRSLRILPLAGALGLAVAVIPATAGPALAATPGGITSPSGCTESATTVTCQDTLPGESTFTVPPGVTSVTATAVGAQGEIGYTDTEVGGSGAVATGTLAVTPGETLYLEVGILGGAAAGMGGPDQPGAGGGESDVRTCSASGPCSSGTTLASRLLVAGGGGGGDSDAIGGNGNGGNAGTPSPASDGNPDHTFTTDPASPGTGATLTAPGTGGAGCDGGAAGASGDVDGGAGGAGASATDANTLSGGGGGAGWFGGGGGGAAEQDLSDDSCLAAGAGGGGSSYAAPSVTDASFSLATTPFPSVTITYPALAVGTTSLPAGTAGAAYSQALEASGGALPYQFWQVTAGSLPPGLSLDNSTGTISGTPTTPGTYNFTVTAADATLSTASQALSITINPAPAVTTTSLPSGTAGTAYSQTLAASGGTPPYTWSLTTGSLPPGLTLDTSTGTISGTPITPGTYNFTAQATDANNTTASKPLTITINPAATGTSCTTTITGTHPTQLTVTSGITCLTHATQNGSVTVDAGAGLIVTNSTVKGTVTATDASVISYCGSNQQGTLKITGTSGAVTLGNGGSCAADTIPSLITISGTAGQVTVVGVAENGTLTLSGNTGGVDLAGINLAGLAYVQNNTGTAPVTVSGNTINGSLYCTGNTPPPGDSGTVNTVTGTATGQCAGLATR